MISTHWVAKRKPYWDRLEQLLAGRRNLVRCSRRELRELSLLYRQTAADLATLRQDRSGQPFALHLNRLLGRAHNIIYAGRRSEAGILKFYRETYPQVFRRTLPYTLTAVAVFLAGALVAVLTVLQHPQFARLFLGPEMMATIDRHEMWTHSLVAVRPLAASGIMTNNLTVSFAAFAAGITAGVGTLLLLVFNGLLLGVVGAACWQANLSLGLWSFVAPHGVLEMPAIFIAAGGGLRLAHGLLFPGLLPRRAALVTAGGEAVRLMVGAIPLLIVAGVIEGFVSPSGLPAGMKFVLGGVLAALLALYLGGAWARPATRRAG